MIIGLAGYKGAGKGTVADILTQHGFAKVSLSSALKDMVSLLYGWPRSLLEGDTKESREWRERPSDVWQFLAGHGVFHDVKVITPRIVLQRFGTDLIRNSVHADFWVVILQRKIKPLLETHGAVVIDDCRSPNELAICTHKIRIVRPGTENNTHISETDHLSVEYDYVINNDSTLEHLESQVSTILNKL